jgi:hypothetical protein
MGACALYALNRWILKPRLHSSFLHSHFNDLLLIPAALPLVLWLQRRLGLRSHDGPPEAPEIALHFVVWSVMAEGIAPLLVQATGDWRDVLSYAAGALVSGAWWCVVRQRTAADTRPGLSTGG